MNTATEREMSDSEAEDAMESQVEPQADVESEAAGSDQCEAADSIFPSTPITPNASSNHVS